MFEGWNYVNGVTTTDNTNGWFSLINPSNEEVYGRIPCTTYNGVNEAVGAARESQKQWSRVSRVKRSDYFDVLSQLIKRDHEKLKTAISVETGKSLNESHAEVLEALHMCQVAAAMGREPCGQFFASELSTKDAYVIRKPRGVVAVISPFNFPLAIGSFWCAAPSIVEGNCVIHKPSEMTPMVNQLVAELYHEAGFPPGVFNLIHGLGETGSYLSQSPVDVILFTGSAVVGQIIRAHCAEQFDKTCSVECGSKSAVMVFDDGDMNLAVEVTAASAFKLSGQRCVSASRILVQRNRIDEFCKNFALAASKWKAGDPFELRDEVGPHFGPLISSPQLKKVEFYKQMAIRDKDSKIVFFGDRGPNFPSKGFFTPLFAYRTEWGDKPHLKQEIFGPHVAIIPFSDLDDAIRIYNDTEYGLALGVITDDYRKHREVALRCSAGMLYVNGGSIAAESHLPFGGVNKSGNFTKSAAGTFRSVTTEMAITVNYEVGKLSWAQGMK
jgi:aldehyde dehydrogenase (NAD+)